MPGNIKVETVGPPFKTNKVKIAQDGEILVKGENVMLGYWNNIEETEKVLKDGWLYTGDIGVFENNYLKITDRKKDILITPGGDNISPLKIENELVNSPDLREFGVDTEEPDLFNTNDETPGPDDLLGSSDHHHEDDDLEIPAFLRRQKN